MALLFLCLYIYSFGLGRKPAVSYINLLHLHSTLFASQRNLFEGKIALGNSSPAVRLVGGGKAGTIANVQASLNSSAAKHAPFSMSDALLSKVN